MNTGTLETYLIPSCSWRLAQQRPGDRSKISTAVVEVSAIKSSDHQHPHSAIPGLLGIPEGLAFL